jgi:hypothetical protein
MSYFGYGQKYPTTSTTSTTPSRCASLKITTNNTTNINASKMNNFKVDRSVKKKIEQIKKTKTSITYPKGKTNNERKKSIKHATNTLTSLRSSYYRDLSAYLKNKAISRLNKLLSSPKDSRFEKVACTIKALFETINKCPSAPQYQYGKTSISSIDSFKKQFIDTYSSDRNKLESATNFIGNIFENRKDSIEAIKNNPNKTEFHSALVKILESKQVCS